VHSHLSGDLGASMTIICKLGHFHLDTCREKMSDVRGPVKESSRLTGQRRVGSHQDLGYDEVIGR
jgi:hypothetical protein